MCETDSISVSRLISLVRDRPVLWDRQEQVYKNRQLTRIAWNEICRTLIDNYDELSDQNKKTVGRSIIGKWANLRDNWLRYWRKRQELMRIGSCTKGLKKYIHHDQLLFLSKVYDPVDHQEVEEIQVDVDIMSDPDMESPPVLSADEISQNAWNVSEDFNNPGGFHPALLPDRHLYFFHSILPMLCDFDDDQTLDFHSAVLDSVRRIKYRQACASLSPTSHGSVINKEGEPKMVSKSINTIDDFLKHHQKPINKLEPEQNTNCSTSYKGSTEQCLQTSMCFCRTDIKEKSKTNTFFAPATEEFSKPDSGLTSLKNVVNKLENISERLSPYFGDSYDQFGMYIGSLLRSLPHTKVHSLKKKIVKEVLRARFSRKLKPPDGVKSQSASNNELISDLSDISNDANPSQNLASILTVPFKNPTWVCPSSQDVSPSILRDTLQNVSVACQAQDSTSPVFPQQHISSSILLKHSSIPRDILVLKTSSNPSTVIADICAHHPLPKE